VSETDDKKVIRKVIITGSILLLIAIVSNCIGLFDKVWFATQRYPLLNVFLTLMRWGSIISLFVYSKHLELSLREIKEAKSKESEPKE
jgi:uncharacterized integral membrane protein